MRASSPVNEGRGQEIAELARLLPGPAERDLSGGRRQTLKEHLMQEFTATGGTAQAEGRRAAPGPVGALRRPHRWRRRMAPLALVATAGAAGASIAVVALNPSAPSTHHGAGAHPGPAGHPPPGTAAQLLARIAHAAERQPAAHVRDSQFEYIRSDIAYQSSYVITDKYGHVLKVGQPVLDTPHERQIWLSVSNLCRPGLLRERGQDTSLGKYPGERCPDKGSLGDPTYRLLQSLPTNPRALLNLIYAKTRGQLAEAGRDRNQKAFETVGDLLRESIAPPQVTAALYRAAALIPGVTLVRHATDAIGHHGIGVARTDRSGTRYEWIFDAAAFHMIGERQVTVKNGQVTGSTAILDRAFVDRPGQVPGR